MYTDMDLVTPLGDSVNLSDFVGKSEYLYIDFWASWCNPCIGSFPILEKAVEDNKDKGLHVITISIDDEVVSWLDALKKVNPPGTAFLYKGEQSFLKKSYNMMGIPLGVMLNKKGQIISPHLHSSQISEFLKEKAAIAKL